MAQTPRALLETTSGRPEGGGGEGIGTLYIPAPCSWINISKGFCVAFHCRSSRFTAINPSTERQRVLSTPETTGTQIGLMHSGLKSSKCRVWGHFCLSVKHMVSPHNVFRTPLVCMHVNDYRIERSHNVRHTYFRSSGREITTHRSAPSTLPNQTRLS